ncbi:MAG: ABC transporter permease [Gemmatimonadetes bacterium]|nr:ABC transporter permease [Gemmatimonadota bacterium]NNK63833.1 ABC transporter permease [Gemmatimonadota bacterium]
MHLWEGVRLAMSQIATERLKSFFSVLGVIIGVMFLIVVVSVVEGMDRYITEDFSSQLFGVNTVTVSRNPQVNINVDREEWRRRARRPRITEDDAVAIRAELTYPAAVGVLSSGGGEVSADNARTVSNVRLYGASPEIFDIRDWVVDRGRAFSAQENEQGVAVVVLGSQTADVLFEAIDPIGRSVRVRGFPYRVIGVLEEKGSLFGQSLDNQLVAPARSPIRSLVAPRGFIDEVLIKADDPSLVRPIQAEVEGIMRVRHRLRPSEPNDFAVETADDSLSFWDRISTILFTALPGLVAISLVVGGIVIMNIMLVSVMERTREIGVRKAIGARRRDILAQVLVESATLSTVGALLGVGAGVALAGLVRAVSPLPAVVAPQWVTLGVVLGISVGVIAGVYPAAQASKLDPVDALRYE